MPDLFISYKREEQDIARKLADALEASGFTVWWDPKLVAGELYDDAIERALEESTLVIVLWSSAAVESQFVKDEANHALESGKLVPVAIDAVQPPFRFRRVQTADLSDRDLRPDAPAVRKLVTDIRARIGGSLDAESKKTAPGRERSAIGAPEIEVLTALDNPEFKRGRRTVGGLATELRVEPDEVVDYLERLEADGLVRKSDERYWRITLAGRALL